jgi:hypothetical protein
MSTNTPGFINTKDTIIPSGSWCCEITTHLGGLTTCMPLIRTNRFFAWSACSSRAALLGGTPRMVGCPQDINTCCPAVGCNLGS